MSNKLADLTRSQVIPWLRKWVLDWLLKKVLGSAAGGIKGWLVKILFDLGWKKMIKPGLNWTIRKATKALNKIKYKKKAEALRESKTEDEFDSAVDDLP